MNIISDAGLTFVCLWLFLRWAIPNSHKEVNKFNLHKFVVFIIIFFSELLKFMLFNNLDYLTAREAIVRSFNLGLIGIVGYSIFSDLNYTDSTSFYANSVNSHPTTRIVVMSLIITICVICLSLVIKIIE